MRFEGLPGWQQPAYLGVAVGIWRELSTPYWCFSGGAGGLPPAGEVERPSEEVSGCQRLRLGKTGPRGL